MPKRIRDIRLYLPTLALNDNCRDSYPASSKPLETGREPSTHHSLALDK